MLTGRVLSGAAWLLAGRLLTSALGFISTLVVARLLVPEQFGVMAIASGVGAIMSALVDLPTGVALIQMKDVSEKDFNTAWTLGVLKGLIVSALVAASAWPVAALYGDDTLFSLLLAMALYPLILGFRNAYVESYARDIDFRREIILDLASKLASLLVAVGVAWSLRSVWALAAGQLASAVATVILSFLLTRERPRFSLSSFSRIFSFTSWLALAQILNRISFQADPLIIGRLLGAATLGQISVGNQLITRFLDAATTSVFRSLMSGFSRIQDDRQRSTAAYLSSQSVIGAFLLPAPVGLAAIAHPLTPLMLGPGWDQTAAVVTVYGIVSAMGMLTLAMPSLVIAGGRPELIFRRDLMTLGIRIPSILVGASLGFEPLLAAIVLSQFAVSWIAMDLVRRTTHLSMTAQLLNVGRSIVSAIAMYSAVRMAEPVFAPTTAIGSIIEIALLALLGALIYGAVHVAAWVAAGRPKGPETSCFSLIASRLSRF